MPVPEHLSGSAQAWLEGLQDGREWADTEWRIALLAAEAWDRSQKAREQYEDEGLVCRVDAYDGPVNDRRYIGERLTPHPAVAIARDAAAAFARLTNQIGLDQANKPAESPDGGEESPKNDLDAVRARRASRYGGAGT